MKGSRSFPGCGGAAKASLSSLTSSYAGLHSAFRALSLDIFNHCAPPKTGAAQASIAAVVAMRRVSNLGPRLDYVCYPAWCAKRESRGRFAHRGSHGLANNLWAQLALTVVLAVIIIALAWAYVW
jgi:hypothetical protein